MGLDLVRDRLVISIENEHVFGDISEEFDFDEPSIDYLDAPLSGRIWRKTDGQWFAFDCQVVVPQLVWHWTLVPYVVCSDVREVLHQGARTADGYWLSINRHRSSSARSMSWLVRIADGTARPVVSSAIQ